MADKNYNDLKKHSKNHGKDSVRLLTTIQITGCTILLIAAACLKAYGGKLYSTVKDWYFNAYNDSIIAEEQTKNVKHKVIDLWSSISDKYTASAAPKNSSYAKSSVSSNAGNK